MLPSREAVSDPAGIPPGLGDRWYVPATMLVEVACRLDPTGAAPSFCETLPGGRGILGARRHLGRWESLYDGLTATAWSPIVPYVGRELWIVVPWFAAASIPAVAVRYTRSMEPADPTETHPAHSWNRLRMAEDLASLARQLGKTAHEVDAFSDVQWLALAELAGRSKAPSETTRGMVVRMLVKPHRLGREPRSIEATP